MKSISNHPPVSVVMSVYNGDQHLAETIESILNQTFSDFEFIIVDDGSIDRSALIVESYHDTRIKFLKRPNLGLFSSLNYGIKESKGEYIARMDADDVALPYRLEYQLAYLKSNSACALLSGHTEFIDRDGRTLYISKVPLQDDDIKRGLPFSCKIVHPACMFQRDHFLKTTGYLEQYSNSAFEVLLWNQLSQLGPFANLDHVLIKYRIRPGSLTGITRFAARRKRMILQKLLNNQPLSERDARFLSKLQTESPGDGEARYLWRLGLIYRGLNNYPAAKTYLRQSLHLKFRLTTLYHYMTILFAAHPR